jgi:hypothetical protein
MNENSKTTTRRQLSPTARCVLKEGASFREEEEKKSSGTNSRLSREIELSHWTGMLWRHMNHWSSFRRHLLRDVWHLPDSEITIAFSD